VCRHYSLFVETTMTLITNNLMSRKLANVLLVAKRPAQALLLDCDVRTNKKYESEDQLSRLY
jgi:hypothetical protein